MKGLMNNRSWNDRWMKKHVFSSSILYTKYTHGAAIFTSKLWIAQLKKKKKKKNSNLEQIRVKCRFAFWNSLPLQIAIATKIRKKIIIIIKWEKVKKKLKKILAIHLVADDVFSPFLLLPSLWPSYFFYFFFFTIFFPPFFTQVIRRGMWREESETSVLNGGQLRVIRHYRHYHVRCFSYAIV